MAEAYQQQLENPDVGALSFDERLALLVDQHATWRENKALARRLKTSRLDVGALRRGRQLPARAATGRGAVPLVVELCSGWPSIMSVLLTGPTGIGKSWLAQALAHKACRDGFSGVVPAGRETVPRTEQAQVDGSLGQAAAVAHQGRRAGGG